MISETDFQFAGEIGMDLNDCKPQCVECERYRKMDDLHRQHEADLREELNRRTNEIWSLGSLVRDMRHQKKIFNLALFAVGIVLVLLAMDDCGAFRP